MFKLDNKIALVTGAGRGIGAEIALDMARAGARVVINYRKSKTAAEELDKNIQSEGGESLLVQADVGVIADIKKMFDQIESEWGVVDILINNAGIETRQSSLTFDEDTYDRIMNTNLKGAFFCAQRAIEKMKEKKWGRVINISSVHEVTPTGFCSVYSMSKGGMFMMTRELAFEFSQYGITVNNIAPGAIRTDMNRKVLADPAYEAKVVAKIPSRFIGIPEDISKAAVFIASEEARYITGASLFIDGGLNL